MDMTCWSNEKIAGLISNYFIGWCFSTFFLWLPDKLGRVSMMKKFCIPLSTILFTCFLMFPSYQARFVFYLLMGFSKLKANLTLVTAIDHLPEKNRALATVCIFGIEGVTIGMFCFYF
mmetsp:Transcript_16187/g.25066  ORF Transcript_16187/g.25066 Transcript_16187/m.25066 type:complete len:118 (-) Transcript_16187:730-1083(-)